MISGIFLAAAARSLWESRFLLTVRREDLGGNVRVVHLSDFHKRKFGRNNSRLVRKVAAEAPDVIVVTGDLVSRTERDFSLARKTVESLCKIAPTILIRGNHELDLPRAYRDEFERTMDETGAISLKNSAARLCVKGRDLVFYGLRDSIRVYKKNGGYRDLDPITVETVENSLGSPLPGETILLAHNPFFAKSYAEWGADYVMSGHVHGGIVRIFGKATLSPERRLFPKYSKGVYSVGGARILVSAGLGKARLFNPSEIVVYEL